MNNNFTKTQELAYEIEVEKAMNKNVITMKPDMQIQEMRDILKLNKISGLPVIDDNNVLLGIISIEDFIKCLLAKELNALIKDKMTRNVIVLNPDEPLIHAVNKFNTYGYGRLPVVEQGSNKLLGILTKGDIIRTLLHALEIDYHEEELKKYRASHIFNDITAEEIMLTLEYNIPGQNFKKGGEAASSLKKNLSRLGIKPQILRRIAIATYEAEMNIVIFTNGGQIFANVTPDFIKIKAVDKGPGIPDIEQAMRPGFSTAPATIRELGFGAGMGLPNIKKCSDKLNIKSEVGKGTEIEIIIYFKKDEKNEAK